MRRANRVVCVFSSFAPGGVFFEKHSVEPNRDDQSPQPPRALATPLKRTTEFHFGVLMSSIKVAGKVCASSTHDVVVAIGLFHAFAQQCHQRHENANYGRGDSKEERS